MVAVVAIALVLVQAASADEYGNGEDQAGYRPDNSQHSYCFRQNFDGDNARAAAHRAMGTVLDDQTTMSRDWHGECDNQVDVMFRYDSLDGVDGEWVCLDLDGDICLSGRVSFDPTYLDGINDWEQTTCHEVGHSVGLDHASWDCMWYYDYDGLLRRFADHHVYHINHDRCYRRDRYRRR